MKYQMYSVKDGNVYTWDADWFDEIDIPPYAQLLKLEENLEPFPMTKIKYEEFLK